MAVRANLLEVHYKFRSTIYERMTLFYNHFGCMHCIIRKQTGYLTKYNLISIADIDTKGNIPLDGMEGQHSDFSRTKGV